jgi:hypothetical protein
LATISTDETSTLRMPFSFVGYYYLVARHLYLSSRKKNPSLFDSTLQTILKD